MAAKTTVNQTNLGKLGQDRLAGLLLEFAGNDPALKRRLKQELAALSGPDDAAREIRKRLATIGRGRSVITPNKAGPFLDDLTAQLNAIRSTVLERDPEQALELIWRFLNLAPNVVDRWDAAPGGVKKVFDEGCRHLAMAVEVARPDPDHLADQLFEALDSEGAVLLDGLVPALTPVLGSDGRESLKTCLGGLAGDASDDHEDRVMVNIAPDGSLSLMDFGARSPEGIARAGLRVIAQAEGDIDAYAAQFSEKALAVPQVAADIAGRYLDADRVDDAHAALDAARELQDQWPDPDWDEAFLSCLEAEGRRDEAQAHRWACFEQRLDPDPLRAYLKRLPDFEDEEAEARALEIVRAHDDAHVALGFLVSWPDLASADALVRSRTDELDGDVYEVLSPAADALAKDFPAAATILYRAMVWFALDQGRTARYKHAARHVKACAALADRIGDDSAVEGHDAFMERLSRTHGRKRGFWAEFNG